MRPMQPKIDNALCTHCGLCSSDCPAKAIDPATMAVETERCMGCGHCLAICPVNAIDQVDTLESLPRLDGVARDLQAGFETLVTMRRSIRRYKQEELSSAHISRILELVRFAPTGTHSQAVGLTVLSTRERVQGAVALALAFYRRLAAIAMGPVFYPFLRLFAGKKTAHKLKGYKAYLDRAGLNEKDVLAHNAPALFIFHAPKRSSTPAEDAVIWATTAALHAETMGIGTCYNGFIARAINGSKKLKTYLGIPKGSKVHSAFTAGYPSVRYQRPAPRKELAVNILD